MFSERKELVIEISLGFSVVVHLLAMKEYSIQSIKWNFMTVGLLIK